MHSLCLNKRISSLLAAFLSWPSLGSFPLPAPRRWCSAPVLRHRALQGSGKSLKVPNSSYCDRAAMKQGILADLESSPIDSSLKQCTASPAFGSR